MLIHMPSGRLSLESSRLLASVRLDGSGRGDVVKVAHGAQETDILGALRSVAGQVEEVVREAKVEIVSLLNVGNILSGQLQAESLDIGLEMSDLAATDNGEQIWGLDISESVYGETYTLKIHDLPSAARRQGRRRSRGRCGAWLPCPERRRPGPRGRAPCGVCCGLPPWAFLLGT